MKRSRRFRLQMTITLLVCLVVAVVLLSVYLMFSIEVSGHTRQAVEQRALAIARTVAYTPLVQDALDGQGDRAAVQTYAEQVRTSNDVEFVVVMNMQGLRLSHPDPAQIGKHFRGGDEVDALHGEETVSIADGSLGRSIRAFEPIRDAAGQQVGAVAVGVSIGSLTTAINENKWILYWGILLGGCLGTAGAILLARKIKKLMFGMEPEQIARLLEERSAMLQSAKEGILSVDRQSVITLTNAEAYRLLGGGGGREDNERRFREFLRQLQMDKVLGGEPLKDVEIEINGYTLLVNVEPVMVGGQTEGAIATFRDMTEISMLMKRLSGISLYAEALRAQTHEFMNRLHIMMGLLHMKQYERLEDYLKSIVPSMQLEAGNVLQQVKDPVVAGFLIGKLSRARELGVRMQLRDDGVLLEAADPQVAHELVTIVGNLLENALEASRQAEEPAILLAFDYRDGILEITVSDTGQGIEPEVAARMYEQGYSTKGQDRGVGLYLVRRSLGTLGGSIEVVRPASGGTQFTIHIPYSIKRGD
ncbi:DcuS/MalK family sensor histidine kinase [Paenibacillus sp. WLX2291]|uniref:DcuS/MalK family sensor histidine kinase n=1 Tax=Paenibacillus sp. WLX2291 TaxID=3296934 RepID=UPI0039842F2F